MKYAKSPGRVLILLTAALLTTVLLTACNALVAAPQPAVLTLIAKDFSYDLPPQLDAGLTKIVFKNEGAEPHHAQFARIKDEVTNEQLAAALQQGPDAALPFVTFPGGPAVIDPGQNLEVTINLTPGRYVVLCFVAGHDGVAHAAKGMVSMTEVVDNKARPAATPKADLVITLRDFAFDMPAEIHAGQQTWRVVNEGPQPHELSLIKLAEGKTFDDVMAFMQNPAGAPPFTDVGGMQALDKDAVGYVSMNLQAGNYVALCFVPDPASHKAHAEMGMIKAFTIH